MALHTGLSTHRRGIALLALPLAAVIGACTSCAASSPQAHEVSSTPVPAPSSSSATEKSLPAPSKAAASSSVPLPAPTGNNATAPTTTPSNSAKQPAGTPAKPESSKTSLSPLASGANTGASIKALPSSAAEMSKATTQLFAAVNRGKLKDVKSALKDGADLDAQDEAGRTALMRAVINKNPAIAKTLFEAGSDPDKKDDFYESPFLRASANGQVETLTAVNRMGGTALTVASENGRVQAVRQLLRTDIPVDQVNDLGWTALHETIVLGQGTANAITIARLLIINGADPHLEDHSGSDAFKLARERQQSQMLTMLQAAAKR
ncbi:MAG: ankyrin repeat domain-containing protein [Glutamicibacter sp.]|uniref:ankyrin repeat domain-containing protein n=1 Tax=Glutamicibacter sp. TaxID=1931995 RepID=UPI002FCA2B1A